MASYPTVILLYVQIRAIMYTTKNEEETTMKNTNKNSFTFRDALAETLHFDRAWDVTVIMRRINHLLIKCFRAEINRIIAHCTQVSAPP